MRQTHKLVSEADIEYLRWLHQRLINVYKEKETTDFVIAVKRIAEKLDAAPEVSGDAVAYRWNSWFGFGYGENNPFGNDSAEHQAKLNVIPLYTTPQPDRTAQLEADNKRLVGALRKTCNEISGNDYEGIAEHSETMMYNRELIAEMEAKG